jgi:hypothetical protein
VVTSDNAAALARRVDSVPGLGLKERIAASRQRGS